MFRNFAISCNSVIRKSLRRLVYPTPSIEPFSVKDRSIYGSVWTESRCTEDRCHEASDRHLSARIALLIFTVKPPIYVPLDGTRTTTGRLSGHSDIHLLESSTRGRMSLYKNDEPRAGCARDTDALTRGALYRVSLSPRCDSLFLNFHILTSGWTRQHHHLTSDGTDISLSWDARVRVGRLCGRRQGDGEVRVQHEIADATHDTLRVSATRCPHDVRRTAFKIRQIVSS